METHHERKLREDKRSRAAFLSAVALTVIGFTGFVAWLTIVFWRDTQTWLLLTEARFPVLVGLPVAALGAFVVVVLLRQGSDLPIEFEGLGFKFKGPSGEVVLWIACFLAIAGAIKILW